MNSGLLQMGGRMSLFRLIMMECFAYVQVISVSSMKSFGWIGHTSSGLYDGETMCKTVLLLDLPAITWVI